jgi:hypothetical protein
MEDCARAVRWCDPCQLQKAKPRYLPLQPTEKFSLPFQAWSIDYLPLLPTTNEGYRHCLIMVDVFSKWIELVPMRTKSSAEVAQAVRQHLFARFGLP